MPDPLSLGNCALWLKADDAATVHATGGLVDQWDDKAGYFANRSVYGSGAGRPTTGTRTINGKNALDFSGTNVMQTFANFGMSQPYTICAVAINDLGANSTLQQLVRDVTNGYTVAKASQNNWVANFGSDYHVGTADDHLHRYVVLGKPASAGAFNLDGTDHPNVNVGTGQWQGGIRIGPSWDGTIGEVVVYAVELNATQRTAMADYFLPWTTGGTARTLIAKVGSSSKSKATLSTVAASKALAGTAAMASGAKQTNILRYR